MPKRLDIPKILEGIGVPSHLVISLRLSLRCSNSLQLNYHSPSDATNKHLALLTKNQVTMLQTKFLRNKLTGQFEVITAALLIVIKYKQIVTHTDENVARAHLRIKQVAYRRLATRSRILL